MAKQAKGDGMRQATAGLLLMAAGVVLLIGVALFGAEGWSLDEGVTADLRADLEALSEAHWLRGNSLLLRRT